MAILALASAEKTDGYVGSQINDHSKVRFQFFNLAATAAQADIGSTIDLCKLPPGKLRVLPSLSRIKNSAGGAGCLLAVGHLAYTKQDNTAQQAADPNAFTPAGPIDIANATDSVAMDTMLKLDMFSKSGVDVQASISGANLPAGASLSGYIAYLYE